MRGGREGVSEGREGGNAFTSQSVKSDWLNNWAE